VTPGPPRGCNDIGINQTFVLALARDNLPPRPFRFATDEPNPRCPGCYDEVIVDAG
jgi:hypothetical protein